MFSEIYTNVIVLVLSFSPFFVSMSTAARDLLIKFNVNYQMIHHIPSSSNLPLKTMDTLYRCFILCQNSSTAYIYRAGRGTQSRTCFAFLIQICLDEPSPLVIPTPFVDISSLFIVLDIVLNYFLLNRNTCYFDLRLCMFR